MQPFHVIQKDGWSYVVRGEQPWCMSGPWRYAWEAQDEANRLNAQAERGADEQSKQE